MKAPARDSGEEALKLMPWNSADLGDPGRDLPLRPPTQPRESAWGLLQRQPPREEAAAGSTRRCPVPLERTCEVAGEEAPHAHLADVSYPAHLFPSVWGCYTHAGKDGGSAYRFSLTKVAFKDI